VNAECFEGLADHGERARSAIEWFLTWRRRLQEVGKASSDERQRRWPMVSGKDEVNDRRCGTGDDAISIMTYLS
jgi:hypothetical protein